MSPNYLRVQRSYLNLVTIVVAAAVAVVEKSFNCQTKDEPNKYENIFRAKKIQRQTLKDWKCTIIGTEKDETQS